MSHALNCNKHFCLMLIGILTLLASPLMASAEVVGWHWYNEPIPTKPLKKKKQLSPTLPAFSAMPATEQIKYLRQITLEARARAVMTGDVADIARYKAMQDYWMSKADRFTVGWRRMLLVHPELDYSVKHPYSSRLLTLTRQHESDVQKQLIKKLSNAYALVLVYDGKDTVQRFYAGLVQNFAQNNHLTFAALNEGTQQQPLPGIKEYPDANHDRAQQLGVQYYPAVMMINPVTGAHFIVAYGTKSHDELAEQITNIVKGWPVDK